LVEVLERSAREFELAGWLEADRPVRAAECNHIAVLDDRLPAELGEPDEQVPDTASLVVGGCAIVFQPVDELLVFSADAPSLARLSPPEKIDRRSSRPSISGLSLSSVRVVMRVAP
jgi:hypothetical protein